MAGFGGGFVGVEGGFFFLEGIGLAVVHGLDGGGGLAEFFADAVLFLGEERAEAGALGFIALFEFGAGGFVVAFDGGEGFVGEAGGDEVGGGAEQAVAVADVVVEEAEGLAGIDGFQPEGDAAELDGHRVDVHAVEAATGDFAEGVAVVVRADGTVGGAEFGEFFRETAGGGEQEVARAAGGIADGDGEEGFDAERIGAGIRRYGIPGAGECLGRGIGGDGELFRQPGVDVGALDGIGGDAGGDSGPGGGGEFPGIGEALADDGFQRGLNEFHDQGVRGVVGAGGFPGVSRSGTRIGDAHEAEGACGEVDSGDEFEQGFIDGAEFLGAHVAVVDGGAFSGFLVEEPAQLAHGGEEVAIGEGGAVEVRALGFREESAEGG